MEKTITQLQINYHQLREGQYSIPDDRYHIAAEVLTPARINMLLSCPFNKDEEACAIDMVTVNGIVGGRCTTFITKMKIGDDIIPVISGSSYEVAEPYRHLAIGSELFMHFAKNRKYKLTLAAGISDMALPIYRKVRFHILEFPRFMLPLNVKSILRTKHLGWASGLVNLPLKVHYGFIMRRSKSLSHKYTIKKVNEVPKWVDDIVLNDGHKYREYHNHEWFQWNLDNNVYNDNRCNQSFFCVFHNEEPLGFYMITERFREEASSLKDVTIGEIVEWGSNDESRLKESQIILLALGCFSENVEIIVTATADAATASIIKKFGFIKHGYSHIALKDNTKQYRDAADISKWRIRLGYADFIWY